MQHPTSDIPWLITESGFFFRAPRRVAPLGVESTLLEVASKHNEILDSLIEAGIVWQDEVAPVRCDESLARIHASLEYLACLLEERAGVRTLRPR